jgi:hypothetical protein
VAENCKKIILMVKQKLVLLEKFENRELAMELAKDYGLGTEFLHAWNYATGPTSSDLLVMKMAT